MENTFSITEARKHFKEILDEVELNKQHIFITKWGKVIAVIIPVEDADTYLYADPEKKD